MFDGYLIKMGDYTFPMKYIAEETYNVIPHQRLDLDSERDNLGGLFREVADNRPTIIEFQTVSGLTNAEVKEIFELIHTEYSSEDERKLSVVYYDPETDEYSDSEEMYMPNLSFPIDTVDIEKKEVLYNPITIKLIGY